MSELEAKVSSHCDTIMPVTQKQRTSYSDKIYVSEEVCDHVKLESLFVSSSVRVLTTS